VLLGGRGAGKTRAGAEWVRAQILSGARKRIALVAPTLHDAREVMIAGPSGLLNLGEPRPRYEPARRRLLWPNGAVGLVFSAEDPDSLRGPQFDAAWADEFCAWAHPGETLAALRLGLRLGPAPQLAVTTTPRPLPALKALIAEPTTALTRAGTIANARNLSPGFLAAIEALWGGTRFGRQEIDGEIVEDHEGALWSRALLEEVRIRSHDPCPEIIVAVDPPAGIGARADSCGIVAAGAAGEGAARRAVVLADASVQGLSPAAWAARAARLAESLGAARIVAEANDGGEMVREVLSLAAPDLAVRLVRASKGKRARAEPIAALYEQGRVVHLGAFPALEDEMCSFGAPGFDQSPDRLDALVWALSDLMLGRRSPRARLL
jgi:phage terminase large subunit-like protein